MPKQFPHLSRPDSPSPSAYEELLLSLIDLRQLVLAWQGCAGAATEHFGHHDPRWTRLYEGLTIQTQEIFADLPPETDRINHQESGQSNDNAS